MEYPILKDIPPYCDYHPTMTNYVPDYYYNVESQEQRTMKICHELKKLAMFCDLVSQNASDFTVLAQKIVEDFTKFKNTGFYDYYEKQIERWVKDNTSKLWRMFASSVFFGLTDDGHFCAYIPDSWNDITFDTGAIYGRSDYGRLCLKMNVAGEGVIDNTYSFNYNNAKTDLQKIIGDLEETSRLAEACYKTLYTPLNKDVPNPTI